MISERDFRQGRLRLSTGARAGPGLRRVGLGAAFKWYRAAAEQGDPTGESNLGYLYYRGQGTSRDYDQAAKWFRPAAQQGNSFLPSRQSPRPP